MRKCVIHIVAILLPLAVSAQEMQGKTYFDLDSSKVREIYHYSLSDSSLQGSYEAFHLNGSLQVFGWYLKNKPDSIWTYYYVNGRKKAEGRFEDGRPKGDWKYYYENGNPKSHGGLDGKMKLGAWSFYYENGEEKSVGNYQSDQKQGIWNYFYEDGKLKAQSYYEERKGDYTEFYPFGNIRMEGETLDEKSVGEWTYYFESGEVEAFGNYENGLKEGKWEYLHKNGQKKATGTYVGGLRDGEWKYYHENGALLQSGLVAKDQKEGYWKLFYPTGELQGEVDFDQGTGQFSEYYTHGGKKSSGRLENELKEGKWVYYSDNGRIEGEADFEKGEGTYKGFYEDGKLKMTGPIKDDKRIGEWTLYNPDGTIAGTYFPIYENEKPIFKTRLSKDYEGVEERPDKPEYTYKRRGGLRYFQYRINEYRALILGTNPVWLTQHELPIAMEYYMQERLGYELQVDVLRDPFFTSDSNIDNDVLFERGTRLKLRQKFYHEDGRYGMLYFGHQVSYSKIDYKVNYLDQTIIFPGPQMVFGSLSETGYSYGLFVGSRWMRDVGDSGWTVDFFVGVDIANRSYERNDPDPVFDGFFDPKVKSSLHFPINFGINIGFASPDNKSKTQ